MNELSLFTGAGGGVLGGQLLGWRTVCAVEIDPYCREVLLRRQEEGHLPPFPVWDDVRTFDGTAWRGAVDIVSAGFPCQPFSVAGKRLGEDDDRNMWPDTIRVIREVGPRYALLENVPGLVSTPCWGTILGDLAEAGLDAEWGVYSAAECGAPHIRKRVWVLAHATSISQREPTDKAIAVPISRQTRDEPGLCGKHVANPAIDGRQPRRPGLAQKIPRRREPDRSGGQGDVPDAGGAGLEGQRDGASGARTQEPRPTSGGWWEAEPAVGRVADGVAFGNDRLRALGNGQVPAVVRRAFEDLTG